MITPHEAIADVAAVAAHYDDLDLFTERSGALTSIMVIGKRGRKIGKRRFLT
jgi:hypothetical protein